LYFPARSRHVLTRLAVGRQGELSVPRSCDVGIIVSPDGTSGDTDALSVNAGLVTGTWHYVAGVFDAGARTPALYLAATGPGGTDMLTRTGYITATEGAAYTVTARTIAYTYDALNRLTKADYSTGESYEYEYDAVGNRTHYTETITQTAVTTYT